MRDRPTENWLAISSPTDADPAVAEVVDVVGEAAAVVQLDQVADDRDEIVLGQDRVVRVGLEARAAG